MDKNEVIFRIGLIRNRANLSARALSQRIELNDGYINRLESKKDFLPTMEVLFRIIDACNSTPAEFFYCNIDAYNNDMQIIEILKGIDSNKKAALLSFLK